MLGVLGDLQPGAQDEAEVVERAEQALDLGVVQRQLSAVGQDGVQRRHQRPGRLPLAGTQVGLGVAAELCGALDVVVVVGVGQQPRQRRVGGLVDRAAGQADQHGQRVGVGVLDPFAQQREQVAAPAG